MPLPKPRKGESQSDFMSRCMHEASKSPDRTNEQNVAACLGTWRDAHGGQKPPSKADVVPWIRALRPQMQAIIAKQDEAPDPEDGESHSDYIDRCVSELTDGGMNDDDAEQECQDAWDDYQEETGARAVVHKMHQKAADGMEFVLSDSTPDRFGDVVDARGWDTENFKRNPIALFSHDSSFIIGRWTNIRVIDDRLRAHLQPAPAGTSARIDEIRRLVEADILRAVSVGFKPIESRPRDGDGQKGGRHYVRHELVECSLVAIPANPNALAVARSLNISKETQRLVFGEDASKETRRSAVRGEHASKRTSATGEHAETSLIRRGSAMTTLSQRIESTQASQVVLRDELEEILGRMDNENVSDADMVKVNDLNAKIAQKNKTLAMLQDSERSLGETANGGAGDHRALTVRTEPAARSNGGGSFAKPKAELDRKQALDAFMRAGVVAYFSKIFQRPPDEMRQRIMTEGYTHYGDEGVKAACDLVFRAAVNPAMTSVAGWAAELVQPTYGAFLDLLYPQSIFPRFSAKGLALSFGRAGKIIIPTRAATPTIAGSFVGEGLPIPVRQAAFTAITLVPKKLAVITTMTREISEHSVPAIEGILRDAVGTDTAVAIDSVLVDANPATAVRPPGLLNGVAALTATAGGGVAAVTGDIKQLVGALVTATKGNIRAPVLLMNPAEVNTLMWTYVANTGVFPFRDEVKAGNLGGYPIIDSATVPVKTVILVDAADFVTAGEGGPMWNVSDVATIHEEDTAPLPIVAGGTPATPVRSLWQTDSIGIRMLMMINWAFRRPGMVSWTSSVTW